MTRITSPSPLIIQPSESMALMNFASTLVTYFDTLMYDRDEHAIQLAHRLTTERGIEGTFRDEFQRISQRAHRAQGIVRHLEHAFSVDEDAYIRDARSLFAHTYPERYVPKSLLARSYNIGIGIQKIRWRHGETTGYTVGTAYDILDDPVEETVEKLKEGAQVPLCGLVFCTKQELVHGQMLRGAMEFAFGELNRRAYAPYAASARTIYHEMRHIVDRIIGITNSGNAETKRFIEAQAYLASGNASGFQMDLEREIPLIQGYHLIDDHREALALFTEIGLQKKVERLQQEIEALEQRQTDLGDFYARCEALIKKFSYDRWRPLSYIISLLPPETVPDILESLLREPGMTPLFSDRS